MNFATLVDLITSDEFVYGLIAAAVLSLMLIAARTFLPIREKPLPLWGPALAAAVIVASQLQFGRRIGLATALVLLVLGGELLGKLTLLGWTLILLGTVTTTLRSGVEGPSWLLIGSLVVVIAGGWSIARTDRILGATGTPAVLLGITAFGIWATVPDAESARVLVGAAAGLAFLAWPLKWFRIGTGGAFAAAALLAWSTGLGGTERLGSIIGGWGSLGVLWAGLLLGPAIEARRWSLVALHGVTVFIVARIAGFVDDPVLALVIAGPTVAMAAFAVWRLSAQPGERPAPPL